MAENTKQRIHPGWFVLAPILIVVLYILGVPWLYLVAYELFSDNETVGRLMMILIEPWEWLASIEPLSEPAGRYVEFCESVLE